MGGRLELHSEPGRTRFTLVLPAAPAAVEAFSRENVTSAEPKPANTYEWPCPGDLLHMDTSRYARFSRPGHRVTGDRSQQSRRWMRPETRVGYEYAHAIVDDHSRLAFVELHDDEKAATVTGFLERALAFFAEHGTLAKRLMTDNGFSYVKNRSLAELLARHRIRHLTTEPYRPRTNGKVERFHQTMAREWAYGLTYRSSRHRAEALPHCRTLATVRRVRPGAIAVVALVAAVLGGAAALGIAKGAGWTGGSSKTVDRRAADAAAGDARGRPGAFQAAARQRLPAGEDLRAAAPTASSRSTPSSARRATSRARRRRAPGSSSRRRATCSRTRT